MTKAKAKAKKTAHGSVDEADDDHYEGDGKDADDVDDELISI